MGDALLAGWIASDAETRQLAVRVESAVAVGNRLPDSHGFRGGGIGLVRSTTDEQRYREQTGESKAWHQGDIQWQFAMQVCLAALHVALQLASSLQL